MRNPCAGDLQLRETLAWNDAPVHPQYGVAFEEMDVEAHGPAEVLDRPGAADAFDESEDDAFVETRSRVECEAHGWVKLDAASPSADQTV